MRVIHQRYRSFVDSLAVALRLSIGYHIQLQDVGHIWLWRQIRFTESRGSQHREHNEALNALKKKHEEGSAVTGEGVADGQRGLSFFPLPFGAPPSAATYSTPTDREILVPVGFTNMATIGKPAAEHSPLMSVPADYELLLLNEQKKLAMITDEKNYLESALKLSQGEADMARKLLSVRQARIDDLERDCKLAQLELQARPPVDTNEVTDLRRQVEQLQRLKKSLDDQALIDHATIAKLRTAVNDQLSKQKAGTDSDAQVDTPPPLDWSYLYIYSFNY